MQCSNTMLGSPLGLRLSCLLISDNVEAPGRITGFFWKLPLKKGVFVKSAEAILKMILEG